jgi:BirA family biotin operon repressor/biotin-[acetyl-CoA-carboxylase] ligase
MFEIHYYDSVGSTMDEARTYINDKTDADYIVIQAGEQTGGRGRRGNQWVSPHGNLYQSIILKPKTDRQYWGQLSFVIAIALGDACFDTGVQQTSLKLKWPNDVLINDQKLAGILIEIEGDHVIIGTGVNIGHAPDDRAKVHDFNQMPINDFRDVFLSKIEHYYSQWEQDGFAPIRKKWLEHAYNLNKSIRARVHKNEFNGVFEGLDDTGTLLLREKNGLIRHINAGEIIACS